MTPEQEKMNLLSLAGVESAQEMIGSCHVLISLKDGTEVCELVQEVFYIPETASVDEVEFLGVGTRNIRFTLTRREPNRKVATLMLSLCGGSPDSFTVEKLTSFSVGEMDLDASIAK